MSPKKIKELNILRKRLDILDNSFIKLIKKRTEIVKKVLKLKKNKNQIIYVGRDSFEKGIDILQNIESKLDGKVIYCTNSPWEETMAILKSSTILVVPSRMESIPQVIKEAFYLKIPVIATSVGGVPEIIENRKNGILISPENPNEMIQEINDLLVNPQLIDELTKNAFDFITRNFTWDVLIEKYIELYEK